MEYHSKKQPHGSYPHDEVSLGEALKIWKYRPFLVGGEQTKGARTRVLLSKDRPPKNSSVDLVYERGSTSIEKSSLDEILDAGGVEISMSFRSLNTNLRQVASDDPDYKKVQVRGHSAQLQILTPNPPKDHPSYVMMSSNNRTHLFWHVRMPDGWLSYFFACTCSEDAMVALADGAREAN